ncbi:MAG: hypothetical protein E6I96_11630 [Chloroflexi bacterium]|nr:MAG: hypothetical protein E6I96_11630 [Chloroflexota bacterium]
MVATLLGLGDGSTQEALEAVDQRTELSNINVAIALKFSDRRPEPFHTRIVSYKCLLRNVLIALSSIQPGHQSSATLASTL